MPDGVKPAWSSRAIQAAARLERTPSWLWFVLALIGFGSVALKRGPDADWDLRNYHLYAPYAALHGRLGFDIAPAQLQTTLNPALDLLTYGLRWLLVEHTSLYDVLLIVPNALAALLAMRIALTMLPETTPLRTPLAALAAAFGATGVASYATLGTAMSDMIPACLALAGLLIALPTLDNKPGSARRLLIAGALFGIAAGLKLTMVPVCSGFVLALLLGSPGKFSERLGRTILAGVGMAATFVVVAGPWALVLFHFSGNPLFPFYNDIFHSPLVPPFRNDDQRFKPHGIAATVFYPFVWAFSPSEAVSELPIRDPRFAIAWCATIATLVAAALAPDRTPQGRRATFVTICFAASFVAWEAQFSIFRYLGTQQALAGLVALPLLRFLRTRQIWANAAFALLCAAVFTWTKSPDWGRSDKHGPLLAVHIPPMDPGALVMTLDASGAAYLVPFANPAIRWVGANNTFIQPGSPARLAQQAESAIRQHKGPLYGIDDPKRGDRVSAQTLAYYNLAQTNCTQIASNLDGNGLRLCRLVHRD